MSDDQYIDDVHDIFEEDLKLDSRHKLKEPKMYRVIMLNDHYTTMDFVVEVLMKVFKKGIADATKIMLDIHRRGKGICGIYTYDIAITKTAQVHKLAREREFPLKCSYEEA
ncbi:MAG: ATP-dependent Clp protease adapter ClpS [Spirochaetota bacterium]|nr:ATP-dependent Clp protease adapter ClpS [Spirochaetota bacterium]